MLMFLRWSCNISPGRLPWDCDLCPGVKGSHMYCYDDKPWTEKQKRDRWAGNVVLCHACKSIYDCFSKMPGLENFAGLNWLDLIRESRNG
jgi:hypothetical protein